MSRNDVGVIAAGAALLFMFMASGTGCGGGGGSSAKPTPTPLSAFSICAPLGGSCDNPVTIAVGTSQQFQAKLTGTGTLPILNWSVNGVQGGTAANGTISNTGLYTAPSAFPSGKDVTIAAADQANASNNASAISTIVDNTSGQTTPIKLGTSGGNSTDQVTIGTSTTCCSGTLGSLIQLGGNFYILSNNHILAKSDNGTATTSDPVTQPGLVDNNCNPGTVVAHFSQAAVLKPNPCSGVCSGPAPSNVDAAIAQIVVGMVDTSGNILDLGAVSGSNLAAAPPSINVAVPATVLSTSEGIAKVGRATGLTCSTLSSVSTTVGVNYAVNCGGATAFTAMYTNQLVINGGSFSASGDSGSLVVTADTARPVGLLYGGNNTSSTANPIQDVLNAFSGAVFVGGGDHAVQCTVVANSAIITVPASAEQTQHALAVRDKHYAELVNDPAVTAVTVGASRDFPGEAVIVVHTNGVLMHSLPAQIEGVATQAVYGGQTSFMLLASDLNRTIAVKEAHVASLMQQPGVYGVGVGRSDDDPSATALVIYIEPGYVNGRAAIPAQIDGERVKIVEGDRFRAYNWGRETIPQHSCAANTAKKK